MTPEQEDIEERAAIMEFDGNLPRSTAEYLARRPASWWEGKTREELSTEAVNRQAEMSRKPEARKVSGGWIVGHVGTRK
jgi:hypothetical protein